MSACKDYKLDCYIGGTVGFRGSLFVHLLETNLLDDLLTGDFDKCTNVYNKLAKLLKPLDQIPHLERCLRI